MEFDTRKKRRDGQRERERERSADTTPACMPEGLKGVEFMKIRPCWLEPHKQDVL